MTRYQIPSDLLSFSGREGASANQKVEAVKRYVAGIFKMLDKAKEEELEEERKRYAKEHPTVLFSSDDEEEGRAMNSLKPKSSKGRRHMKKRKMKKGKSREKALQRTIVENVVVSQPEFKLADEVTSAAKEVTNDIVEVTQEEQDPEPSRDDDGVDGDSDGRHQSSRSVASNVMDYTELPALLDKSFDTFDKFNALRATTISAGQTWSKTAQRGLLSKPETTTLSQDQQRSERNRAFDLLDALSKSGGLTLKGCTLHIVLAATHCFDLHLLNTIVQDNINPIDRVEASGLIMVSTIFRKPASELVQPAHQQRIADAALSAESFASDSGTSTTTSTVE